MAALCTAAHTDTQDTRICFRARTSSAMESALKFARSRVGSSTWYTPSLPPAAAAAAAASSWRGVDGVALETCKNRRMWADFRFLSS